MISEKLRELREAEAAATKGPWNILQEKDYFTPSLIWSPHKRAWDEDDEEYNVVCRFDRSSEYGRGLDSHIEPDASLIALARNHFSAMLDVIEAAQEMKDAEDIFAKLGDDVLNSSNLFSISDARKKLFASLERLAGVR